MKPYTFMANIASPLVLMSAHAYADGHPHTSAG